MALQAEQPVGHGVIALLLQQGYRQEFALGLGHFAVIGIQVVDMEPVVAPLVAQIALGLCNFIGMVGERVVDAAAVNIQILAKVLHGNAGALDVPAGIAHAPGRIPLEGLILKLGLGKPKDKIIFVPLVYILFHALPDADSQIFLVMVVEYIILFQRRSVKVHVAAGNIRLPLVQQGLHHMNILRDAVSGRLHHIGPFDVQFITISKKSIGVKLGNLHNGFVLPAGALEHLVLAGVRVRSQVTHIGDVHHPLDVVAIIAQCLFQHILHDVGTQVADVGIVVHRWAACVHFHNVGVVRNEQFLLVGQ